VSPQKAVERLAAVGLDAHVTVGRVFSSDRGVRFEACVYRRTEGRLGAPLATGSHPTSRAKAVDAAVADMAWWQS